ncbi:hypothetical protein HFP57_13410 [Parasphingopyxis algicola]|uniref:hypothetical protein n=1 Tax=Parasphingopyxis algicola TaxID=2026624 RepID=UPI0015A0C860|nr:hypothetical protein [Parasphingopyxis algicola]QLC25923.1 hypothetical protein HFP57_13410 [Parasphingopyxis algicola]
MASYTHATQKYQTGGYKSSLVEAGLYSEHVLRALTFEMTGSVPTEIKHFGDAASKLSKTTDMPEATRILIPKILSASAYDMRSKRGAVHVKGVNPQKRDALQALNAMSWALAELLAQYGNIAGHELDTIIDTILRRPTPLVEHIGGQHVVTQQLQTHVETLLIIDSHPDGISRRDLGKLVKRSSSSITHALTKIEAERLAHKNEDGRWFITSTGEKFLERFIG